MPRPYRGQKKKAPKDSLGAFFSGGSGEAVFEIFDQTTDLAPRHASEFFGVSLSRDPGDPADLIVLELEADRILDLPLRGWEGGGRGSLGGAWHFRFLFLSL